MINYYYYTKLSGWHFSEYTPLDELLRRLTKTVYLNISKHYPNINSKEIKN